MSKYWRGNVVIMTPAWLRGDGVGHDVEGMARVLLGMGYKVHVFSPFFADAGYTAWAVNESTAEDLLSHESTLLIYHHSIGCEPTERLLKGARSKVRILRYHNVTPPAFFDGYNADWVNNCTNGRKVTYDVVRDCTHFLIPSYYDGRDLINAGADPTRIHYVPYFHKLEDFDRVSSDVNTEAMLRNDRRLKVLFVGRRVNNKGHKHLLQIIARYCEIYDRDIILHLVGAKDDGLARYNNELEQMTHDLKIADNVVFYDKSSFGSVIAFYKNCDVFLCASEHEGFCIPVIEAEYCGLPVVAYYYTGVPEALGPTQISIDTLNYDKFADALRRLRAESGLKASLSAAAAESVRERFNMTDINANFTGYINELTEFMPTADNVVAPYRHYALLDGSRKLRVAFVVQRFGNGVSGGAEAFVRLFAEKLSSVFEITVISTNALTLDWESALPIHADQDAGDYSILRFPTRYSRDWQAFFRSDMAYNQGKADMTTWMSDQGPHAPEMGDYLLNNWHRFDVIVNWTYLYTNMEYVARLRGKLPLVCVPFLHDESFAYMPGFHALFNAYNGFIFQTFAEQELANNLFQIQQTDQMVLGCGINEGSIFAAKPGDSSYPWPYVIYLGRIEPGKNVKELFEMFRKYKAEYSNELRLLLVGKPYQVEIPDDSYIVHAGFVSDEEKQRILAGAIAMINPSHTESFSLVLLESWAQKRPVIVSKMCNATSEQVRLSGGGVAYSNYRDFAWCLNELTINDNVAAKMGHDGYAYYLSKYRWQRLVPRFATYLNNVFRTWAQEKDQIWETGELVR